MSQTNLTPLTAQFRLPQAMAPISILMYHSIDDSDSVVSVAAKDFDDQMSYLADRGIRGVSLYTAVSHRESTGSWPDQSMVLTFDDGFANFYERALPSLARYGFTATVFIVSGYMGEFNDWEKPPAGLGRRRVLSWKQAAELVSAGMEIGSHTHSHPDLAHATTYEAKREIVSSREEIEARLGAPVKSFAYPYGSLNTSVCEIVEREFQAACTTKLSRAGNDSSHRLPRIDMHYIRSRRKLEQLRTGRLDRYLNLRRVGRAIRRAVTTIQE